MGRRLLVGLGTLVVVLAGATAWGSHYPIEVVPFIDEAHKSSLAAQKLTETKDLLDALLTSDARRAVSKKTGIEVEKLEEYAHLCDLLRVRGLGPKMARLMMLSGIDGIEALRAEKPAELLPKLKGANDKHGISEILPQEETLNDWIHQARALPIVVK